MKIVSDSSCNLRKLSCSYTAVPMKIMVSKEYIDDDTICIEELLEDIDSFASKTSTSCPNADEFLDACKDDDEVFLFTISRNMSGSYNAARLASEELKNKKIFLVDSLSAGPGVGILIKKTEEWINKGYSFDEIKKKIQEYQKHTEMLFGLKSIKNLANNGRCNPIIAKAIGLLGVRLIGSADKEGRFEMVTKAKGRIKTIKALTEQMIKRGYAGGTVLIDHVNNLPSANDLKKALLAHFPDANITINPCTGLCSYYAEAGGLMIGYEK